MNRHYIATALLLLAVAGAYGNSLWGKFTFDDDMWVVRNPRVTMPSEEKAPDIYRVTEGSHLRFRWLSIWTFRANYLLHGLKNLPGWHIANILVHFGCVFFLYLILLQVEKLKFAPRWTALIAALVFAVWPIGSEAVNYISARQTMLVTFFTFASVYLTLRALDAPTPTARSGYALGVLVAWAGASLSKEVGLGFPPLFIIATVLAFSKETRWFIDRRRKVFISTLGGLIVLIVIGVMIAENFNPDLWKQVKRKYTIVDDDVAVPSFAPSRVFEIYHLSRLREFPRTISLVLAPLPQRLSVDHHTPWEAGFDWRAWVGAILLVALLTGMVVGYLRAPTIGFGLACFLISLLPYWTIPSIIIVEYKLHLLLAGVAVCFGFTIAELRNALPGKRKLLIIPPIVLLVIWGALMSAVRNADWRDPMVLWKKAENLAPAKARPSLFVGDYYRIRASYSSNADEKNKNYQYAINSYMLAANKFRSNPLHKNAVYKRAYSNLAIVEYWRGNFAKARQWLDYGAGDRVYYDHLIRARLAVEDGRPDDAERQFKLSLGSNPYLYETLEQYTLFLISQSRLPEAATYASTAIRYYPNNPELRLRLADVRLQQKDYSQARGIIKAVLREYPKYPQAHLAMSIVALEENKLEKTIECLDKTIALGLDTWQIHWLRGKALIQQGKYNEAERAFNASISRSLDVVQPHKELAEVLQKKKDFSAALEQYCKIREIEKKNKIESAETSKAIASILYDLGRYKEATQEYLAAVKVAPNEGDTYCDLALCYLALNKKDEAVTAARKAIETGVDIKKLPEHLQELLKETQPKKP